MNWDVEINLLGSVLNLECGRHAGTSSGWVPTSSVDSVDFLQVPSCTVSCDQLQPSNGTVALATLPNWSPSWSRYTAVLRARSETEIHSCSVEIEGWGCSIGKVVVSADGQVGW